MVDIKCLSIYHHYPCTLLLSPVLCYSVYVNNWKRSHVCHVMSIVTRRRLISNICLIVYHRIVHWHFFVRIKYLKNARNYIIFEVICIYIYIYYRMSWFNPGDLLLYIIYYIIYIYIYVSWTWSYTALYKWPLLLSLLFIIIKNHYYYCYYYYYYFLIIIIIINIIIVIIIYLYIIIIIINNCIVIYWAFLFFSLSWYYYDHYYLYIIFIIKKCIIIFIFILLYYYCHYYWFIYYFYYYYYDYDDYYHWWRDRTSRRFQWIQHPVPPVMIFIWPCSVMVI